MPFAFKTRVTTRLADTDTPISIYLKIRDRYPGSILLESAEEHGSEHRFSYICCQPIAGITVANNAIKELYPDGSTTLKLITESIDVIYKIALYMQQFSVDSTYAFNSSGLFGYMSYDAVQYFESITINASTDEAKQIPDIRYHFYKYVLVYDHFRKEINIIEHILHDDEPFGIEQLEVYLRNRNLPKYPFKTITTEASNFTDESFLEVIAQGKKHCYRGDVFQIVLSREFSIRCSGDDLNVYRALRSVNPSPYLFYFDYGDYKLMGSSPEAQLKIKNGEASIFPIAGTYRRTGNAEEDNLLALQLQEDKKENAEHVMLVDLARNDLSKNYKDVSVAVFKEIQFFSHVIHIVSKVTGTDPISAGNTLKVVADTFPAGTLSGAPKHKAMQLIDKYEQNARGFYGGCIGYMGFDGTFNHAIMIRSFLCRNNTLFYRAGAGIVAASVDTSELQEINNKVDALRKALHIANSL